jgi:hypothetical protein
VPVALRPVYLAKAWRQAGPSRERAVDAFHNLIHDTGPGGFRDHTERDVTLTTVPDDALAWYGTWGPCMTASNREPLVKDTRRVHIACCGSARRPERNLLTWLPTSGPSLGNGCRASVFARDKAMPRKSAVTCDAIASQLDAPATSKLNQRIMQRTMSRHATVV